MHACVECFCAQYSKNQRATSGVLREIGEGIGMHLCGQRTRGEPITVNSIHSTFFEVSLNAVVCRLYTSMGSVQQGGCYTQLDQICFLREGCCCSSLRSYRVHNRGAGAIGRHDIFVKTVLLPILLEGFTSILLSVGFFPFPQLLSRFSLGDRCWNGDRDICYWDCRFTLAIIRYFRWSLALTAVLTGICDSCPGSVVSSTEQGGCL